MQRCLASLYYFIRIGNRLRRSGHLDRGFYSNEVFSYLQNKNIPHIVPVRKHGKELKKILRGNHSRYAQYTMKGTGEPLDLTLAIDV